METVRERIEKILDGKRPERLPAYTPTIASDVASRILGRKAYTGGPELWYEEAIAWTNGKSAWEEFNSQVVEDIIAIHRVLGWDVIRLPWRNNIKPSKRIDECTFVCGDPDGMHQVWKWDPQSMNFFMIHDSSNGTSPEDWPELASSVERGIDDRIEVIRSSFGDELVALQKRVGDDMYVIGGGAALSLGVDESSLIAAVLYPEAVEKILDCQLQVGLAQLEALAKHGIKVVLGGGDMADKNGPIYSPEMFYRFMAPRWEKIADKCRELDLHYVWRSDGNIWKISDFLFKEAKFPGYGEVDFDASMTTAALKERYPELVIWANVSGDKLRRCSSEEVYKHCMEILYSSDGKGHVYGCSNTILPGTPVENVYSMMQALDDFSRQNKKRTKVTIADEDIKYKDR